MKPDDVIETMRLVMTAEAEAEATVDKLFKDGGYSRSKGDICVINADMFSKYVNMRTLKGIVFDKLPADKPYVFVPKNLQIRYYDTEVKLKQVSWKERRSRLCHYPGVIDDGACAVAIAQTHITS